MKRIAILHEGNVKNTHDNKLIKMLIEHLGFDTGLIDFYGMGIKSNFFKPDFEAYQALKPRVKDKRIRAVLFIVDADDTKNDAIYGGYENTQNALNKIIAELEFQEVSSTYIMCDPTIKIGYLESFILSTIPKQQRHCIESFLDCSQFKSKENHKAILNQIYNIAYPNAPYNFAHSHFEELKLKLTHLFSED